MPRDWIDYNGHVNDSRYLLAFGEATDALLRAVGVDDSYVAAGASYYTVETHLSHLGAAYAGDRLTVTTQVLGVDDKRLQLFHTLERAGTDGPLATAEQMLLHVDTASQRAAPAPEALRARLGADRDRARGAAAAGVRGPRDPPAHDLRWLTGRITCPRTSS